MKNVQKALAFALLSAIAITPLFMPSQASACSCMMQPDLNEDALKGAGAVFSGTFVSSTPDANGKMLTFDVSKTWKGPNAKTITAHTPMDSAGCGWDPEVGKEYLVYAYTLEEPIESGNPGDLHINLCSRVFLLADAGNDLASLGEGKVPVAETPAEAAAENGASAAIYIALGVVLFVVIAGAARRTKGKK